MSIWTQPSRKLWPNTSNATRSAGDLLNNYDMTQSGNYKAFVFSISDAATSPRWPVQSRQENPRGDYAALSRSPCSVRARRCKTRADSAVPCLDLPEYIIWGRDCC